MECNLRGMAPRHPRTLPSQTVPAEITCVPRPPKRLERVHADAIDSDEFMADAANLDVPEYRRLIKRPAAALIDEFVATWNRQPTRGRKPEAKRDALINALARLFHDQSGWQERYKADSDIYEREYRVGLRGFLVCILAANGIDFPPDRLARLRVLAPKHKHDPDYRKPRE